MVSEEITRKNLDVTEMNMFRWMCSVTEMDKVGNDIRETTTNVVAISKIMQ